MLTRLLRLLAEPFAALWRRRALLAATVAGDLKARHVGSVLGPLWVVLYPLLFLAIYASIYLFVFQARTARLGTVDYALLMFGGLVPFIGFAESLGAGVGSVTANAHLVRNTLFPIELVPVRAVLAAQATPAVGGLMLVAAALLAGRATPRLLLLPVAWGALVLFTLGVIWVLSSLNVVARDLQSGIGIVNLLLMAASPIAFTTDMMPERIRLLVELNPLAWFIVAHQQCLLPAALPARPALPVACALGLAAFWLGFRFFLRVKGSFFDHV